MENNFMLIKDMRPGLKNVSVVFIVLESCHLNVTKGNREVRTFRVADQSACINASVWDEAGLLLSPGDIVRLTKGHVSLHRNYLTLNASKGSDLQKIGEFCMVFNEQLNMSEPVIPQISNIGPSINLPLNNGTNNGAGRVGAPGPPPSTTSSIIHNNIVPAKSTSNPNHISSSQDNQKRSRNSKGGQQKNRQNRSN